MGQLLIRDLKDETLAALDALKQARGGSREAIARQFLDDEFTADKSPTVAIAQRLRWLCNKLEVAGQNGDIRPAPTPAIFAQALGHDSVTMFEALLKGIAPLSFTEGTRLTQLVGASPSWLLDDAGPAFAQQPACERLFAVPRLLAENENNENRRLIAVLAEPDRTNWAEAAIFEKLTPMRYRLIARDITLNGGVGAAGGAQLLAFAAIVAHEGEYMKYGFGADTGHTRVPMIDGYVLKRSQYNVLVNGKEHPSMLNRSEVATYVNWPYSLTAEEDPLSPQLSFLLDTQTRIRQDLKAMNIATRHDFIVQYREGSLVF